MQIALELIEEMAGQAGLVAAKNIKFTSPVIPEDGKVLRFDLSGKDGKWGVEVYDGEVLAAKMSLTAE